MYFLINPPIYNPGHMPPSQVPVREKPAVPRVIDDHLQEPDVVFEHEGYTYLAWWPNGNRPIYRTVNCVKICRITTDGELRLLDGTIVGGCTVRQYPYGSRGYNFRLMDIKEYEWI